MGCLEALITVLAWVLKLLVAIFIPIYIVGIATAVSSGMIFHPFVLGCILFFGLVILAALRS